MAYNIDNCGLLIGLTSIPFGKEPDFPSQLRDKVFKQYKGKLLEFGDKEDNDELKDLVYEPTPYFLFGSFDLAVLSLADDFTLANRIFHPHATPPADRDEHYNYQMIIGSHPLTNGADSPSLAQLAKDTFLRNEKRFPFIGITTLKLNNMLLCCSGLTFYEAAIKQIRNKLNKSLYENDINQQHAKCILLETYSWHELTVVIFADTLEAIPEAVLEVRETAVSELKEFGYDIDEARAHNGRNNFLNNVFQAQNENSEPNYNESHILLNTDTIMGVDYDLFIGLLDDINYESDKLLPIRDSESTTKVSFSTNWDVKPGHLGAFAKEIIDKTKGVVGVDLNNTIDLTVGDGLLVEPRQSVNVKTLINEKLSRVKDNQIHLHKLKTQPSLQIKLSDINFTDCDKGRHPTISNKLIVQLSFSSTTIDEIKTNLGKLKISAVLRERILNMYYDYNSGIRDSSLFIYFIELYRFLEFTAQNIQKLSDEKKSGARVSKKDFHTYFFRLTQYFEQAFNNRFHISSQMEHLTDYNMDYNGGMQQFISCIDAAHKNIAGLTGEYSRELLASDQSDTNDFALPRSFALVTGHPVVDSLEYAVRLNYFHFLQPMFFSAVACHELANFMYNRNAPKREKGKRALARSAWHSIDNQIDAFKNVSSYWRKLEKRDYRETVERKIEYIISRNSDWHPLDMDWLKKLFSNFHLYNYVLADAISYYITYQRNAHLLYYWHWMNQLQSSEFYDYEGQINKQEFVYNSLRICILLKALGKEDVYKTFNAPCAQLQKYWVLYQGKIIDLIDAFFAMNDESEDGVVSELLRFLNDLKLPDTLTPSATGFHGMNEDNEKCIEQLLEQIESGRVEPAWKQTTNEPNNEAVLLLHALLLLVKQQNDKHKGNIALTRRVDNTPVCTDTDAPYLADPMGGIFTHNTTHRLNLFKYTATFYKLLWHVSLQQKAVMIETVIKQKQAAAKA